MRYVEKKDEAEVKNEEKKHEEEKVAWREDEEEVKNDERRQQADEVVVVSRLTVSRSLHKKKRQEGKYNERRDRPGTE